MLGETLSVVRLKMKVVFQVVSNHKVLCPENMGPNSADLTGTTDSFAGQVC